MSGSAKGFGNLLKTARERAGLTQLQLAEAADVRYNSLTSWESGRRRPRRDHVIDLADALSQTADETNVLLRAAGHAPVPDERMRPLLDRRQPLRVIQDECDSYPWPCLVMNEDFEVVGWNAAANDLSELDLGTDLSGPGARQLLRMAALQHYRDKLLNWDAVIGVMIAIWKNDQMRLDDPAKGTAAFNALVAYLMEHHQELLEPLGTLWAKTEPFSDGYRLIIPVDWRASDGTRLAFNTVQTSWSDFDGAWCFEWHPANAVTWNWLDARRATREAATAAPPPQTPAFASWRQLLREARRGRGFSQRQLANDAGLAPGTVFSYESGRREASRETILALCRALQLDGARTNAMLLAAGHDQEPSDWALFVAGERPRLSPQRFQKVSAIAHHDAAAIQEEIRAISWPSLVVNARCEAVCANPPLARLLGTDPLALPAGPARNLLALVTGTPFRVSVRNWDETVAQVIPPMLAPYLAGREAGKTSEYFRSVVEHVQQREASPDGDPRILDRLWTAWRSHPRRRLTARTVFTLEWAGTSRFLRFDAVISPWNIWDPFWAIDLHPADADTWRWFAHEPAGG